MFSWGRGDLFGIAATEFELSLFLSLVEFGVPRFSIPA